MAWPIRFSFDSRSKRGVDVARFLLDSAGSRFFQKPLTQWWRHRGCIVLLYKHWKWARGVFSCEHFRLRQHRKDCVIDMRLLPTQARWIWSFLLIFKLEAQGVGQWIDVMVRVLRPRSLTCSATASTAGLGSRNRQYFTWVTWVAVEETTWYITRTIVPSGSGMPGGTMPREVLTICDQSG